MPRDTPDHLLDRALPFRRLWLPAELLLGTMFLAFRDQLLGTRTGPTSRMTPRSRGVASDVHAALPRVVRGLARSRVKRAGVSSGTANHRPMRRGNPADGPTIQITDVDYLAATRPMEPTHDRLVERTRTSSGPLDERTLIDELWRISHFGWIPEGVIQRAPTLARGQEIPPAGVHQGLRELLARGWVEHHDGDANIGEHHWRLTDSGRDARVS